MNQKTSLYNFCGDKRITHPSTIQDIVNLKKTRKAQALEGNFRYIVCNVQNVRIVTILKNLPFDYFYIYH